MVPMAFAVGIGQAGVALDVHSEREVETFRIARTDLVFVRVAEAYNFFSAYYRGWAVTGFRLRGAKGLGQLCE
jgi:hypothetical protein